MAPPTTFDIEYPLPRPPAGFVAANEVASNKFYFIPSSEFNAYLKQIKVILSAVKKYRIISIVTNIFSLQQTKAVLTIEGLISFRKDLECTDFV